jgi:hypothetical protein
MNKEQIIDEAYEKYDELFDSYYPPFSAPYPKRLTKEEFINKIKTDSEFSDEWGLKIEERELGLVERRDISRDKLNRMEWADVIKLAHFKETYDKYNIPTKLITITYKNETIMSYE